MTIQISFVSLNLRYFKVSTRYKTVLLVFVLKLKHLDDNQESNKKDQARRNIDSKSSEASLNFTNSKIFPLNKRGIWSIKYFRPFTNSTIASALRCTQIFVLQKIIPSFTSQSTSSNRPNIKGSLEFLFAIHRIKLNICISTLA